MILGLGIMEFDNEKDHSIHTKAAPTTPHAFIGFITGVK